MDRATRAPVFDILDANGQNMRWLARVAGVSYWTLIAVKYGRRKPNAGMKAALAQALHLPEAVLFRPVGAEKVA
jgi:hypothetical protein